MNNYQILGLNGNETKDEIKSKFRSLSKKLHPDVNGGDEIKTKKFVDVLRAYNELMDGVTGVETKQDSTQYTSRTTNNSTQKKATYKFITILKNKDGYIIRIKMDGVVKVRLQGKHGVDVGMFDINGAAAVYNLRLSFEDAKRAKYEFKITLYDNNFNSAVLNYKVKPEETLLDKIFSYDLIRYLIALVTIFFILTLVVNLVT